MGFSQKYRSKKYRISYKLGDSRIEIENDKQFPIFLEVEAPSLKEIEKTVKLLGFRMSDTKNWGYMDLVKYYKHKK